MRVLVCTGVPAILHMHGVHAVLYTAASTRISCSRLETLMTHYTMHCCETAVEPGNQTHLAVCLTRLCHGATHDRITGMQDEVGAWESRLATLLEGLALLQAVQRRWLYLAPIFGCGALPAVAARFRHVDGEFKSIMQQLKVRTTESRGS